MKQIAGEYRGLVGKIYLGKLVAVVIFSLVPLMLTVGYGIRDYPGKSECKAAPQRSASAERAKLKGFSRDVAEV